jgi:hypothetical protein
MKKDGKSFIIAEATTHFESLNRSISVPNMPVCIFCLLYVKADAG